MNRVKSRSKYAAKIPLKLLSCVSVFSLSLSLSLIRWQQRIANQRFRNEFPLLSLNVKFSCKLIAKRIDPMIHKQMYFTRATILLIAPPITMWRARKSMDRLFLYYIMKYIAVNRFAVLIAAGEDWFWCTNVWYNLLHWPLDANSWTSSA